MNTTLVLAKLDKLGVAVVPSTKDSFKLRTSSGPVPEEAVKLAREHKPALLRFGHEALALFDQMAAVHGERRVGQADAAEG